ncbi:Flavohemoprotein [Wickerhamiella sorbophila]|uniref:nitric oxide dioxygenase n=1 Tax=Wickerhamiella sorbophila TaxID=45607 RepID=A0A2T0FJN8_9ASCO|nr:Flavohemoprotein [Wickerhamiella sorbophila]PRT55200.1 Flavohemoprotein [Wickerhamiella sorbophila]
MLSREVLDIIRATVPVLEKKGVDITARMYEIMVRDFPAVKNYFNPVNFKKGTQQLTLANAILAYAKNIERPELFSGMTATIVQKHCALDILPEHYPWVGQSLLKAIEDVLGSDVATKPVLEAWGAAYFQLADFLIAAESKEYNRMEASPGGWRHTREFKVASKTPQGNNIVTVTLEPVDGKPVYKYEAGQYMTFKFHFNEFDQRRHYSLREKSNGKHYTVSVKLEDDGAVSQYIHNKLNVGDVVELLPPFGDFVLRKPDPSVPIALLSGGIGITPLLSMGEALMEVENKPEIHFYHWARGAPNFTKEIENFEKTGFKVKVFDSEKTGHPTAEEIKALVPKNADCYFVGPKPFMKFMEESLIKAGLPEKNIHYEFYGPTLHFDQI